MLGIAERHIEISITINLSMRAINSKDSQQLENHYDATRTLLMNN